MNSDAPDFYRHVEPPACCGFFSKPSAESCRAFLAIAFAACLRILAFFWLGRSKFSSLRRKYPGVILLFRVGGSRSSSIINSHVETRRGLFFLLSSISWSYERCSSWRHFLLVVRVKGVSRSPPDGGRCIGGLRDRRGTLTFFHLSCCRL